MAGVMRDTEPPGEGNRAGGGSPGGEDEFRPEQASPAGTPEAGHEEEAPGAVFAPEEEPRAGFLEIIQYRLARLEESLGDWWAERREAREEARLEREEQRSAGRESLLPMAELGAEEEEVQAEEEPAKVNRGGDIQYWLDQRERAIREWWESLGTGWAEWRTERSAKILERNATRKGHRTAAEDGREATPPEEDSAGGGERGAGLRQAQFWLDALEERLTEWWDARVLDWRRRRETRKRAKREGAEDGGAGGGGGNP